MPDHLHIFIGIKPSCSLSNLVQEVKKSSNKFIKENKFTHSDFHWQQGFGAFSYSHSHINNVVQYINNQKEHHKVKSFREEYLEFLEKFDVEYQPKYLFDWIKSE
jgi:REP element-mobilizing transposase RayT